MTDNLLRELSQIQQYAAGLQDLLASARAQAPPRSEGADRTGTVRVLLNADGLPDSFRIESGWHRKLAAETFGDAVVEAFQAAMGARLSIWTQSLKERGWQTEVDRLQAGLSELPPLPFPAQLPPLLKGLRAVTPPSKGQITVATDTLRAEAGIWDQQSNNAGRIASQTDGLRMDRFEAGIFQIIISAYGSVVDQVTARSREGQQRMTKIADTLHQVANTYDQEESENLHALKNLY